jgi:Ca2+-binding RTX toxin-like protein
VAVLTLLVLAIAMMAGTALAATINGDGTLVGTPGRDTLNAGNADDIVWGLGGSDTINAGNGNDMIDGGGHCPMGDQGQDFPNGIPGSNQCEHGNQGDQGGNATINAGNGNDTVWGGPGPNTINVGAGTDTIYGGPNADTINTGSHGTVSIFLGAGAGNTVNIGTGSSGFVNAQNGQPATINCSGHNGVTVYVDKPSKDQVNGCKTVTSQPAPAADPLVPASRWRHAATRRAHRTSRRVHGSHHRARSHRARS